MQNSTPLISVVSPVYKAEASLDELYKRLVFVLEKITNEFEIILVNDGSPQKDWQVISRLAAKDNRVKGINLSRNFGQHNAIFAGLNFVRGEWVVVMDCDLQDRPEEILNLFKKVIDGNDYVLARRANRQDSFFKKISSSFFYKIINYLAETRLDSTIAFGIYNKKVINAVCDIKDSTKYFPAMVSGVGFRKEIIDVEHSERLYGKTSYSFKRLVNLAIDIIIAFSDRPLKIVVKIGLVVSIFSTFVIIYYLLLFLIGKVVIIGWVSLMLSVWLLGGIIIFILGIIGLYLSKTYEITKGRSVYIVDNVINVDLKK